MAGEDLIPATEDSSLISASGHGKGDFISDYADYADILEAPREVHAAVAISLLAAALNPRVRIQHGGLGLTLDLWTLILSGSGLGRNTLVSLAYAVLISLPDLVRPNEWGSGPAFYEDISRNPAGLFIWPEMGQVLKTLNQSQFIGVKEWLTDRFDNTRVPNDIRYRTGRKTCTPTISFSEAPRLNILATSSVDWFVPNLAREDTTGGFLPRWLIVRVSDTVKIIPKPKIPNSHLVKPLADHLERAKALSGAADLSLVEDQYADWYRKAWSRFDRQPNRTMAMPFFNRQRSLVLKLAVIFEVSASCTLSVSAAAMDRAIAWASSTEDTVFKLLPTGLTAEGFALDRMEQVVKKAGVPGIIQSELTRAFQGEGQRNRTDRMTTLIDAGKVYAYERPTAGRKALVYVWADFRRAHEADFPADTPR